jgi:hypothetical protein
MNEIQRSVPMVPTLVFLARAAEPTPKIADFVASYKKYDAGVRHKLVVLYKGGLKHSHLFADIQHQAVDMCDDGLDITAYLNFARAYDGRLLCFVNSNTRIRSAYWLKKLEDALCVKNAGMVGATGSYESLATSFELMVKLRWITVRGKFPFDDSLATHYRWLLSDQAPRWLISTRRHNLVSRIRALTYPFRWKYKWSKKRREGSDLHYLKEHLSFPNPHIRSNVFMIDRNLLLDIAPPNVVSKEDAYAFESGKNNVSRQLMQRSLRLLVVNSSGKFFDIPDWAKSQTYRISNQELLLASDNQTDRFERSDEYERGILTMLSWGLGAVDGPKPPHLGLEELMKNINSVYGFSNE